MRQRIPQKTFFRRMGGPKHGQGLVNGATTCHELVASVAKKQINWSNSLVQRGNWSLYSNANGDGS